MRYNGKKQKSFVQNLLWIGILLLAMGAVFLGVAVVMQLVPMTPESIQFYSNGVRQPSTEETVRTFRLIFLLAFGAVGLGLAIAGFIVTWRTGAQRKLAKRLKEEGVRLTAVVIEYSPVAINANGRNWMRLRCAHTDFNGQTYIFKSGTLRIDPMPYLAQGQVDVYHDRDNMSCYFVDIDGSVGLGSRVVEL